MNRDNSGAAVSWGYSEVSRQETSGAAYTSLTPVLYDEVVAPSVSIPLCYGSYSDGAYWLLFVPDNEDIEPCR